MRRPIILKERKHNSEDSHPRFMLQHSRRTLSKTTHLQFKRHVGYPHIDCFTCSNIMVCIDKGVGCRCVIYSIFCYLLPLTYVTSSSIEG